MLGRPSRSLRRPVVMGPAFAGTTAVCQEASRFVHASHAQIARRVILPQAAALAPSGKSVAPICAFRAHKEGASRSSRNVVRDTMDAAVRIDEAQVACGPSCVVLMPRRWHQVGGRSANDGGYQARTPGRARSKPQHHRAGNVGGGLKRSSQHRVFSLVTATRQALPLGFSIRVSFSVWH